jgi:hypothetical protein
LERKVEEQARRQDEVIRMLQQVSVSQSQNLTLGIMRSVEEINEKYDLFVFRPRPPEGQS